jgi:Bacterial regulatory helix-turn-helix protein, lysR family
MNIHYLELFYYVARHGGIVPAVRNMPYDIQQPAVSGQIARLEESLGTKLFNRRPFALLPAGKELFEFIRPFFDEIDRHRQDCFSASSIASRASSGSRIVTKHLSNRIDDVGQVQIAGRDLVQHRREEKEVFPVHYGHVESRIAAFFKLQRGIKAAKSAAENQDASFLFAHTKPQTTLRSRRSSSPSDHA